MDKNKKKIKIAAIVCIVCAIAAVALGAFSFIYEGGVWLFLLCLLCAVFFGGGAAFMFAFIKLTEAREMQDKVIKELSDAVFELSARPSAQQLKMEELKKQAAEKQKEKEKLAALREEQDIRDFREKVVKKYQNVLDAEGPTPATSSTEPVKPLYEKGFFICPNCGAKQPDQRQRCWKCDVPFIYY